MECNLSSISSRVLEDSIKLRLWFILSSKIHLISHSQISIGISCLTKVLSFKTTAPRIVISLF